MLVVVIAVCIGILVGMAVGTKVLTLRRRREMARARERLAEAGGTSDTRRDLSDDAELSDAERATFEQIFRENFPDVAGPPPPE